MGETQTRTKEEAQKITFSKISLVEMSMKQHAYLLFIIKLILFSNIATGK